MKSGNRALLRHGVDRRAVRFFRNVGGLSDVGGTLGYGPADDSHQFGGTTTATSRAGLPFSNLTRKTPVARFVPPREFSSTGAPLAEQTPTE